MKSRSKALVAGMLSIAVAVGLTACASGDAGGGDGGGGDADATSVGVSLNSLEYPMVVIMNDSMKAVAEEEGLNVTAVDARNDVATELAQIEDLITKRPDVIIVNPVDAESSAAAGRLVNEAGIPLVTFDNNFADDANVDVAGYVGSDATESGRLQAEWVNSVLPDGGNIIYLVGIYGAPWTERRMEGFYGELNSNIEVATETEANGSRADAKTVMEDLLRRYPNAGDIDAVVAINDEMAIGAISAIEEAGRLDQFPLIIGADGGDAALQAVEAGSLTATVAQDPELVGATALETAVKVAKGESVEKINHIKQTVVTKDNIADYLE